jgi:hypothetical protein
MSNILQAGETGFGILIESDAGFVDINENRGLITENFTPKEGEPILINCVLQKWGVKNNNGRIYPKDILIKQVEEFQKLVESGSAPNEADHPDCVSASESMICSKEGWKTFDEISNDEEILTLNIHTNEIEIQKINKKIYEPYKGIMYKFTSNNMNLTVTPNHRFLIENNKGERFYETAENIYYKQESILIEGNKLLSVKNVEDIQIKNNEIEYINISDLKIEQIDFDDNIACVTVPNENFLVSVNGKSHWTGNSSIVSLLNISHLITKMWWGKGEKENILYGQIKLIVSPGYLKYGIASVIGDKILLYLQNNMKMGISSRGVGSLKEVNGENLVQDDFELIAFDLVAMPSTPGAFLFPGQDNVDMYENENKKNEKLLKEDKKIDVFDKFLL